jgi:hypothetical protein
MSGTSSIVGGGHTGRYEYLLERKQNEYEEDLSRCWFGGGTENPKLFSRSIHGQGQMMIAIRDCSSVWEAK